MNWRRLTSIMRKETIQILRDRRSLGSILIMPIMQLVLYGYLSNEVLYQGMIVWDQSKTAESRELIRAFETTRYFQVSHYAQNLDDIEAELDRGGSKLALVIPPDYAKLLRAGKPTQVMVAVDATNATTASLELAAAAGVGTTLSQRINVKQLMRSGAYVSQAVPIDVRTHAWYNPDLKSEVFIIPGVLAMIMQFTSTFLSISTIVKERELGTLEQLVVTPVKQTELLLGKIIPLILLCYVNMTFILILGRLMFGVEVKGSMFLLYAATLAFFFSTLGLGTLFSTVSRSFQQAMQLSQLVLLPSMMLSGFIFPRESLPTVLQWVGQILPLTYFIEVVRGIVIKGVGIHYLWLQIVLLFSLGVVVFGIAVTRFSKKVD